MKEPKVKSILFIILLLTFLQILLFYIKKTIFVVVKRINYTDHIVSMFSMIILLILFIVFVKKKKMSLSVFPERFDKYYMIGTCGAVLLFVTTPSNYLSGYQAVILLFYSSVVVPAFEEVIFRGCVWNKLNTLFRKEWITYIVSTILFALWHLGYIDTIAFRVDTGLATIMFWKVITGLCFGIILGAVRYKTKNIYSTMLLHGVMNIFGR